MEHNIFINEVVHIEKEEQLYRVLWVSPEQEYGYWISLEKQSRVPERFVCPKMLEGISTGAITVVEDPVVISKGNVTETAKEKRDEWWHILKPVLECEPDIYERRRRGELLSEVAKGTTGIRQTYTVILSSIGKKGKTPNAFLPDYRNCGKGDKTQKDKKLGRPVKHDGSFGKVITKEDVGHFEAAIRKYYLKRKRSYHKSTYEKMLGEFYSVTVQDQNGNEYLQLLPEDQIPSITQFRYWYKKNQNIKTEIQKRKGDAKFELTGRAITGRSDYQLMGPGAKYQIDATVGDIYLVSQFDRSDIIGRPVMYFVMDSYSRMVTGMYVGLEGPSWAGAMMAIENAASDKVAYCSSYGVTITEDEWPCHHIPTAILGDRGEMESKLADNLVQMLGIRIENAPPYRADLKGIIEQHFRTININALPFLSGKVLPDMSERGGHDYRLDAKLDIRQFTEIIIRCVLYYNNSHCMDYFEKSEQMMQVGVDAVPLELWNFGIRYCSGCLRTVPKDTLRLALMPADKASVTERGIRFKGMYYSCEEAIKGLWFEKARAKGAYRVKIYYDPRDMGVILAESPNSAEIVRCELVDWEVKYAGKQLDEVRYEQEKEKIRSRKVKAKEMEAKINLGKQIENIVDSAEKKSSSDNGIPKAERIRNIRGNRRNEREEIRKQETFTGNETGQEEKKGMHAAGEPEVSPIMRLIQQQVEEEIKDDALYGQSRVPGTGDTGVPGNPLIEALPDIWSGGQVIQMLSEKAAYNNGERKLDMQYRMHCIYRLFRYFQPLEQHIDIEQRISRSIRQGYLYRNSLTPEYAAGLADGYAAMKDKAGYHVLHGVKSAASGFTIIGVSGVGKSTAVEKILSLYPQRIVHTRYRERPLAFTQLVWLKLDCPHDGSLKQLCYQFFYALDLAAGTDYFQQYTKGRYSLDMLLIIMTQLVRQFQIGILVIDEIQHLSEAKGGGSDKMLNFFVTLVNTIGLPVVMIGTTKAMSILQGEFRQARRGSGQGDLIWDRMKNDAAWQVFVKSMWRYQWTKKCVPYSDEMVNMLYDESQGIIDIAVKLYAIVQIEAITNGVESFSASDIHKVAKKKLGLVKPMLDALRSGDRKKILRYEDITPVSIEDYLSAYQAVKPGIHEKTTEKKLTVLEQTVVKLLEVDVDPPVAKRLAGKVIASHKNPVSVSEAFKEAYRLYISEVPDMPETGEAREDLRKSDGYEDIKRKGLIDETEW